MCYRMLHGVMFLCLFLYAQLTLASPGQEHVPSRALLKLIKEKPEIKTMLIQSINEAQKIVPDKQYNPVQNFSQFLDYADRYANTLPGALPPGNLYQHAGSVTREGVHQNIMYFYFLLNQPLAELQNKGYFSNSIQYYPPFAEWLVLLTKCKEKFLSSPASWDTATYEAYRASPDYHLMSGDYGQKNAWKTYNEFFSRSVIAGARPITAPDDPDVVVSPADSVPQGMWRIDAKDNIQMADGLKVKFIRYYNVPQLLKNSPYRHAFKNGYLTHTYLNVNDYHRYIFPVAGEIVDKNFITENMSLDVDWNPSQKRYELESKSGWQFSETRGYVIIKTPHHGLVAVVPIGMEQVSSVNFDPNVLVGKTFLKGSELGYFLFGASDIILIFQENSHFRMDAMKNKTGAYEHLLAGQKYGLFDASEKF